jgi:hypothetical protein
MSVERRVGDLLFNARVAKNKGFSRRERRDLVIAEVAQKNIIDELEEVKNTALDKYFIYQYSSEIPVVVSAIHATSPGGEYGTGSMARTIANIAGIGMMISKKSRDTFADANRKSFRKEERTTATSKTKTKESPTSVRAALYWGIRRNFELNNQLTEKGDLSVPALHIAVHGMKDRSFARINQGKATDEYEPIDFVIGEGAAGITKQVANPNVLDWFARSLVEKSQVLGLTIEGRPIQGAIERKDSTSTLYKLDESGRVQSEEVSRTRRNGKESALSGSGLGLEDFRYGCTFNELTVSQNKRRLRLNGMGRGYNTIQLEISSTIRQTGQLRENISAVLANISTQFVEEFSTLSSLE